MLQVKVTQLRDEHGLNTVTISQQEKSKPMSLSALLRRHAAQHMEQ